MIKKVLLSLVAFTFLLGYDTDEELIARVKIGELEQSYNGRVLGRFDESGHLLLTPKGVGICITQMLNAQATFDDLHQHYVLTDALGSQETRILRAKILNTLRECKQLEILRG